MRYTVNKLNCLLILVLLVFSSVGHAGRCISADKPGYIKHHLPSILKRLNFEQENWLTLTTQFENLFHGAAGRVAAIENYCSKTARKRRSNLTSCKLLLAN